MKIIVYEPKKLLFPDDIRKSNRAKRIITAVSVIREKSQFRIVMNAPELKRTIEFIKERSMSGPFFIFFEDLNKWISSITIVSTDSAVIFEVFEENIVLIINNSEEV